MSRTDINNTFSEDRPFTSETSFWNGTKYAPQPPTKTSNLYLSGTQVRQSQVTAGYIRACETGRLNENAFAYRRLEVRRFVGTFSYKRTAVATSTQYGCFSSSFCLPPSIKDISSARKFNLQNEAKQKVLEKIRNSDVNLAVAFGERKATMDTIANAVKRLGQSYNRAKHGDLAGAAKALGVNFIPSRTGSSGGGRGSVRSRAKSQGRAIANGWLELQYGWMPLMSDINGAIKVLEAQMITQKEYVSVKSKRHIEESSSSVDKSDNRFTDDILYSTKYTVIATAKMRRVSQAFRLAAELGFTNPALVAWELVPFSFVVDWAIPIGSFISQFDSALGWQFEVGSLTTIQDSYSVTTRSPAKPPGYEYLNVAGTASQSDFKLDRFAFTGFADYLSIPYIKDPSSVTHVLNALALLTSKR